MAMGVLTLCLTAAFSYHMGTPPAGTSSGRHIHPRAILSATSSSLSPADGSDPAEGRRPPIRRVANSAPASFSSASPPASFSSPSTDDGSGAGDDDDDGFVFGVESIERATAALREGGLVLLTEDGSDTTCGMLVASPQHVDSEQVQFMLEHTVRLQAALEPSSYRAVYRSLHKIVLDNNNLAQPALSVAARGAASSPRNATHIAAAVDALMQTRCWEQQMEEEPPAPYSGVNGRDAATELATSASLLVCPGAISLNCARVGGILRRAGATEASIEIAKRAGLPPISLHAALPSTSLAALRVFAQQWGIPVTSTADLVAYARKNDALVERCGPPARMPTKFGRFVAHTFRSRVDGTEHIALVKTGGEDSEGEGAWAYREGSSSSSSSSGGGAALFDDDEEHPFAGSKRPALVRVHSECCTGDVFGSLRCDCGPQLEKALEEIQRDGWGVLLYLRGQEGRGIGLGAKMHAYALQERGLDTLDANTELGLPVDSREYGTGAQILADLGITDMRLMSNNPKKFSGLAGFGLNIVERVPSHTAPNPENVGYLRTKLERMGHMLGQLDDADVEGGHSDEQSAE